MRRFTRVLPVPLAAATVLFFAACDLESPSGLDGADVAAHHSPGHEKGGGNGGGGDDDGGGGGNEAGPLTVVFPDDLFWGGFGIATTGTGGQDLTGENTAEKIELEGSYSFRFDVTADPASEAACPLDEHPLVALFNDTELNSPRFTIRFDKEADGTGSFEINDRIRVDLNDLADPAGDPDIRYSVWFRGKGHPDYDPHTDVQYEETTDDAGDPWTSIRVEDEDVFVKKLRCRNKKCNSVEVLDRDLCETAANYSLKVSR